MEFVEFWTVCGANGIIIEDEMREQLKRYSDELVYWNSKVNLISRKDEENVLERHILHSLSVLKYIDIPPKARCMDIGTGGGLPGIPLKILNPDISMTLVDSIKKKIKTTSMLADHTGLRKIFSINSRVEDLTNTKEHFKKYDFIFARAVKSLVQLTEWTKDLLNHKGFLIVYKGGDLVNEIREAKKKYTNLVVKTIDIDILGAERFKKEEKKILICNFDK